MMSLQDLIRTIEEDKNIGIFSKSNKTVEEEHLLTDDNHTYKIPFALKPSQQVLAALGGPTEEPTKKSSQLTAAKNITTSGNPDVKITSFIPKTVTSEITITGARIDRLFKSAKLYINTDLFPEGYYEKVRKKEYQITPTADVGLCHAQEIDLLVDTKTSKHGKTAHTTTLPNGKIITEDAPAILLLSSSRINWKGIHAKDLKHKEDQLKYISGMYHLLFNAARSEGREYIVMPPAGLGKHGGSSSLYFAALMLAAADYPSLKIIFNAGDHAKKFDEAWEKAGKPDNVGRTTKNIIFVAAKLIQDGKSCAIHNPSYNRVLYGLSDVGAHWQSIAGTLFDDDDPGKTLQAYIGTVTTAVLGSYGVNPEAYSRIVEKSLESVIENTGHRSRSSLVPHSGTRSAPPPSVASQEPPSPSKPADVSVDAKKDEPAPVADVLPPEQKPVPKASSTSNANGFFPATPTTTSKAIVEPPKAKESLFSDEQLLEINRTINHLNKEIQSCWPYPNKDVKQIKMDALNDLIRMGETMQNIPDAIKAIKETYPRVVEGRISTRTSDLLRRLEASAPQASAVL